MNTQELLIVTSAEVHCDGGSQSGGHPMVYLNMGAKTDITCPYCGKKFMRKTASSKKNIAH